MAENIEPSPAKRPRKPNFTPAECAVIFEEAEENLSIIKSKFSLTLSNKNKSRVWEEITSKVNALDVCKRSVAEVKEKWTGMVSSARKEHNKSAASRNKTGWGRKPGSPKGTTVKIIQLYFSISKTLQFPILTIMFARFRFCFRFRFPIPDFIAECKSSRANCSHDRNPWFKLKPKLSNGRICLPRWLQIACTLIEW